MFHKMIFAMVCFFLVCTPFAYAENTVPVGDTTDKAHVIVFVRDGCSFCKKEERFLAENTTIAQRFDVEILNIGNAMHKQKWEKVIAKYQLSKVTPITLVGGEVLIGFNEQTIGQKILSHANDPKSFYIADYIEQNHPDVAGDNAACQVGSTTSCSLNSTTPHTNREIMTLPFFGQVNVKETSLFFMSAVLGFVDGFNPCAMWVLLTFLIILSQIGDRKKMFYLAGIFILAEAIMYFFILNVWYQTWDFIKLDQIVTPLVGLIAIGAGVYFLRKWYTHKGQLTCNVTSMEHQQKTTQKIKDVVARPMTIITVLSVLGIAFSVNIIEFACSVGLAQSFTKILEINTLSFIWRQVYIAVYALFYMADDFVIFGLALFGYQKFHAVGTKYSHLSNLIGGILMLLLGVLLIFFPDFLVFG